MKKSKSEAGSPKRSKKSSRKKKKKKKKKSEGEKRKKAESSSTSDDSGATKDRQRRKRRKSKCKNNKYAKIKRKGEDSSSEDSSDDEKEKERRTSSHKKRKQDSHRDSDSGLNMKKRRRNWKAADDESSHDSSADWDVSGSGWGTGANAGFVCLNFRHPSSAGLFHLQRQQSQSSLSLAVLTHLYRGLKLHALRDGGFWGLSRVSWGALSGGASLIPSTLLSIGLIKRSFFYFWDIVFINEREVLQPSFQWHAFINCSFIHFMFVRCTLPRR